MVPVQTAQYRRSIADEKTIPVAKKLFLAGIFFIIGGFAAVIQLHPSGTAPENTGGEYPALTHSVSEKQRTGVISPILSNGTKNNDTGSGKIPLFSDSNAPYYDKGNGKYMQAYPQPVLLVDGNAVPAAKDSADSKTNEVKKTEQTKPEPAKTTQKTTEQKTAVQKAAELKPAQITQAEFKPLHQFPVSPISTAPENKPAGTAAASVPKAELNEEPKPVPAGSDDYLPVFDFAENLASAKHKKETELPVNPFPMVQPVIHSEAKSAETKPEPAKSAQKTVSPPSASSQPSPPQVMQPFLFQKLKPLSPQGDKEIKADSGSPEPADTDGIMLLHLSPLAGLRHLLF